jgi:AraC-like DNA-binding protein
VIPMAAGCDDDLRRPAACRARLPSAARRPYFGQRAVPMNPAIKIQQGRSGSRMDSPVAGGVCANDEPATATASAHPSAAAATPDTARTGVTATRRDSLQLGPGWAVYGGEAGDNSWHSHHALQLTLGLHHEVSVRLAGGIDVTARGVLIPPGQSHHLLERGTPILSVYLDGHSTLGRALAAACADGLHCLDNDTALAVLAMARQEPDGAAIGQALLAHWQSLLPAPTIVPAAPAAAVARVRQVLDLLAGNAWHDMALDLASLAARAALSPSHFAQCLRAETGLPLRAYLRWQRLQRAVVAALAGATLTQAAHDAGFADAAHLTRTFRRHFGHAPSTIFANISAEFPAIRSSVTA